MLLEVERKYEVSLDEVKSFLAEIYTKSLPNRGESSTVYFGLNDSKELTLNRTADKRFKHINLCTILDYPCDLILNVFCAMLAEKRIIFLSSKLR